MLLCSFLRGTGFWGPRSHRFLRLPTALSSEYLFLFFSPVRILVIGCKGHCNPGWYDLKIINFYLKRPFYFQVRLHSQVLEGHLSGGPPLTPIQLLGQWAPADFYGHLLPCAHGSPECSLNTPRSSLIRSALPSA